MKVENGMQNRFTIIVTKEHRVKLNKFAKSYKITQGEVVEVLLDYLERNEDLLRSHFEAKREVKVDGRGKKSELFDRFKKLTPEQIALLEKLAAPNDTR
jgi:hypothetical protein